MPQYFHTTYKETFGSEALGTRVKLKWNVCGRQGCEMWLILTVKVSSWCQRCIGYPWTFGDVCFKVIKQPQRERN